MATSGKEDDSPLPFWRTFLEESSQPFQAEPVEAPSEQALRQLYTSVLANYGHSCAMTGQQFGAPEALLHEQLQVVAIRPLVLGGALHVSNFLSLSAQAASAFRGGLLTVGKNLELIADLSRIDPELLESLNPIGRLRAPEPAIAQPDPLALAFHRANIFLAF